MMGKVIDLIEQFERFNKTDIKSAILELKSIQAKNRIHLQKLVFIDLVNRFDSLVDDLLREFSLTKGAFNTLVLQGLRDVPVYQKDVYELLLSSDPKDFIAEKLVNEIEIKYLRKRHSDKLAILLKECFNWTDNELFSRRLDTDGSIRTKTERKKRTTPLQVIGFADWLYSRRNALVHGSGNKLFDGDIDFMRQKFNVTPPSAIYIRLNSIQVASTFYINLCKLIRECDKQEFK